MNHQPSTISAVGGSASGGNHSSISRIVAFTKDWDDVPTCTTHILREMAKTMPVLWINSIGLRRPSLASGRDIGRVFRRVVSGLGRAVRKETNLRVLAPLLIPGARSAFARALNRFVLNRLVERELRDMGDGPVEYWCFVPTAVDFLPNDDPVVVYYCVDDWGKFENLDGKWLEQKERELLARADVIFTPSRYLKNKCSRALQPGAASTLPESSINHQPMLRPEPRSALVTTQGKPSTILDLPSPINHPPSTIFPLPPVVHMPHGVDHAKFAAALDPGLEIPADMVGLPKPIIGFYGNIYPWIDFGLVEKLATARSAWTFVVIGQIYCDVSRLQSLPNVRFLGRREHSQLPGYCKAFDAAIIPYDSTHPRMESVNPVKTKELLAAGVPVVAAGIPELTVYGRDVLTCSGVDEWLSALEAQIARTDRKDISQRMKKEDWTVKVAEMRRIAEC